MNEHLVARLGEALRARGARLVTAESCTGGLLAAACTSVAGSSDWFERGFVTYSNAAKSELLGVPPALIERHGAVSAEVAAAMAEGALRAAHAELALAVTGIAGPGGAVPGKPVGTVWFGLAAAGRATRTEPLRFDGDRAAVRGQAVRHALERLLEASADGAVRDAGSANAGSADAGRAGGAGAGTGSADPAPAHSARGGPAAADPQSAGPASPAQANTGPGAAPPSAAQLGAAQRSAAQPSDDQRSDDQPSAAPVDANSAGTGPARAGLGNAGPASADLGSARRAAPDPAGAPVPPADPLVPDAVPPGRSGAGKAETP
jgi:nicotinamide-nucleotide amidase